MVLRRELGGNAVDEKSVAVGIGVGYQEDPRWAKKSNPPGGGGGILKNHLSCTVCCGYSLEAPCRGASNKYPKHMFLLRNKKVISIFRMKKAPYLLLCMTYPFTN